MACDDSVVRRGAIAEVYAESILKVAERTLARSHLHQLALFSARQTLERRLDMILTNDRMRAKPRQWRYMIAPAMLIAIAAWVLVPTEPARSSLAHSQTSQASLNREVQRLGEDKAFDGLIEMALRNPDAELRDLAVTKLTELEGDGSTAAMVELYDKSSEANEDRALRSISRVPALGSDSDQALERDQRQRRYHRLGRLFSAGSTQQAKVAAIAAIPIISFF